MNLFVVKHQSVAAFKFVGDVDNVRFFPGYRCPITQQLEPERRLGANKNQPNVVVIKTAEGLREIQKGEWSVSLDGRPVVMSDELVRALYSPLTVNINEELVQPLTAF